MCLGYKESNDQETGKILNISRCKFPTISSTVRFVPLTTPKGSLLSVHTLTVGFRKADNIGGAGQKLGSQFHQLPVARPWASSLVLLNHLGGWFMCKLEVIPTPCGCVRANKQHTQSEPNERTLWPTALAQETKTHSGSCYQVYYNSPEHKGDFSLSFLGFADQRATRHCQFKNQQSGMKINQQGGCLGTYMVWKLIIMNFSCNFSTFLENQETSFSKC